MAFTKQEKDAMVAQYEDWLKKSQAVFVLEYSKMTMKDVDTLRAKVRGTGGELHVVKNTLLGIALDNAKMPRAEAILEGSSIVGFAFQDAPAMAKVIADAGKGAEIFKVKGGYLGAQVIDANEVKSLAELPPLPVMRARLLGVFLAPASQLVRTLAEPARQVAAVVKAYSEKEATPAAG